MRHKRNRHQLNRFTSYRDATLSSLARNVIVRQSIRTTLTKAMAARSLVEQLITLGKKGSLSAKRDAFALLNDHKLVSFLCTEIAPRFAQRNGGYTRIIRLGQRRGDSAQVCIFELTEIKKKEEKKPKKKAKQEAQAGQETAEKPVEGKKPKKEERPSKEEKAQKEEKPKKEEKHKPPLEKKPSKKFLGGLRKIFKKERDSL